MDDDIDYRAVSHHDAERANRADWDAEADRYQREHGAFLGDARFVWCPEGLDEATAQLLGPVAGRRVLEIGCGAGQCARWLRTQGADAVGIDLSLRQLQHSARLDDETGVTVPVVCAAVNRLPFATASFDLACSAFGALPFVVDIEGALTECARVLRPGARFVFSVVHPVRRMFPDDPTARGQTVIRSYFDRRAYVENDETGTADLRGAAPHHGRLGGGNQCGRVPTGPAARAGVAAGPRPRPGAAGVRSGVSCSPAPRSLSLSTR